MIPPTNVIPDNSVGKENEREQHELPQSPSSSISQQESKLQRLKRVALLQDQEPSQQERRQLLPADEQRRAAAGGPAPGGQHQRGSPDRLQPDRLRPPLPHLRPRLLAHPGRPRPAAARPPTAHSFLEHIFKKPTFCDVCNHMIVGECHHL
ncbi:hypothetical protein SKAU_G00420840 [Synaphobranchus kaupii]|uniref:Phorbol-ester/DAG-type domain-containing protein n=1 Tax=Synaphobranchus kaupii TaxID=118154 RepID=A0A9Q1E6L2_SYNKA|nr:hypothetical protein SKAU_G00420840 [Synaphobranchus kaupii]